MVKSDLKKILDERDLSIRQVAKGIDYRLESVRQMYNDDLERYPRELLSRLCDYLDCTPGDLLILTDEKSEYQVKKDDLDC